MQICHATCMSYLDHPKRIYYHRHPERKRRIPQKNYYVYILTNKCNSVLYVGITNNLIRRIFEHKHKVVKGFTKKYNLYKLVYLAEFNTPIEAIAYEKKIKGWKRSKKDSLITLNNPRWTEIQI